MIVLVAFGGLAIKPDPKRIKESFGTIVKNVNFGEGRLTPQRTIRYIQYADMLERI